MRKAKGTLAKETAEDLLDIPSHLPLLAIRDMVVFPYAVIPLLVGREKSLAALEASKVRHGDLIVIATQRNPEKEQIQSSDIYRIGTVSRILQVLEFPNGHAKVVVEGIARIRIGRFMGNRRFFEAKIDLLSERTELPEISDVYVKQLIHYFQEFVSFMPDLPDEMIEHLRMQHDPQRMIDFVALHIQAETADKQKILEDNNLESRLHLTLDVLRRAIGFHRVRREIDQKVQDNLLKNQRNYYVQEKLRVINKELGEEEESSSPELVKLEKDILAANMPEKVMEKATEELGKLKKIPAYSPEYTVARNYLDWMISVPWKNTPQKQLDISDAQRVLDEDHFGLKIPKERIIEHLAVINRVNKIRGPILCFVGPPGVGKTSLGKSVARALGRKFVRISLGGIRDEAEIRGHRRTYIGSMPGKIIQSMKKAGSNNPVFLLDEIDKMNADFRGDPASALLEVLDPEQNKSFNDHYLDIDYDLSNVFFITTANVQANIPLPLQDRMETISIAGYLEHEKIKIARNHLIPKQFEAHGLKSTDIEISDEALIQVIREYTRESGVRNLERYIATLCRKSIVELTGKKRKKIKIDSSNVTEILGKPLFLNRVTETNDEIGVATGLAWTPYGGDVLKIEASVLPGKGKLILTGKLGDVMKESAQAAISYIRSLAADFDIPAEIFEENDLHLHVPEGAIPKDGPSAGVTIAAAMLSAFSKRPLKNSIAMSGEITLRGKVLAIGGVNEKLLAAQRNNIVHVILPAENEKEINDLPGELQQGMQITTVSDFREILEHILAD